MRDRIIQDDCISGINGLTADSVDSVVTDPPYGIGFHGKHWDSMPPGQEIFEECLRVLKPGGHLIAFGGSRTYHRLACAVEDAGFEIRDQIQWLYGTGQSKSRDISKDIDKKGGENLAWFIDYILRVAEEKGVSRQELTMLFPSKNGKPTGWLWNKRHTQDITIEQYNKIKEFLDLPFDSLEEAKREVIGTGYAGLTSGVIANFAGTKEYDITAPATDNAKSGRDGAVISDRHMNLAYLRVNL